MNLISIYLTFKTAITIELMISFSDPNLFRFCLSLYTANNMWLFISMSQSTHFSDMKIRDLVKSDRNPDFENVSNSES